MLKIGNLVLQNTEGTFTSSGPVNNVYSIKMLSALYEMYNCFILCDLLNQRSFIYKIQKLLEERELY